MSRPPAELAQALRTSHGIDVADVEVRRDAAASAEAALRRARAFTRAATVYLPDTAGSLSNPSTRGLLAHELVHAAQQRRFAGSLPAESSAEGRALEAEALAAESAHGGSPALTSDEPLRHAPPVVSAHWVEDRLTQHALDLPPPANYPSQLNQATLDEVRYTAQEIVREAANAGVGGAGGIGGAGGLGGGARNVPTADEFRTQLLTAINVEREAQHLSPISSFDELGAADRALVEDRMRSVGQLRAQMDMQDTLRKRLEASQPHEAETPGAGGIPQLQPGTTWTPEAGFQQGGAPSRPGATEPGATAGRATGAGAGAVAGAAPGALPGGVGGRGAQQVGVGATHARTRDDFLLGAMIAINAQRDPHARPLEFGDLSHSDQELLSHQWEQLEPIVRQQEVQLAFQRATAPPEAGGSAPGAVPGAAVAPAAATSAASPTTADGHAAAGVHAAGGTHAVAAAPTADHGNVTPMGREQLSLETIDLTELSVRLYDRLRSRLRTELLIDRERAGLLTDFR